MPSVLLVGATGMVGASLSRQLKEIYPAWPLTVYFRNPVADDWFRNVVHADRIEHGTFEEAPKVSALAAEHDIVINAGSSFDPTLSKAIIEGLKQRKGSKKGTLIHVSGGGNFIDHRTDGKFSTTSKVWNDANEDDIKQVNSSMLNGAADRLILDAGNEGSINTFIVCQALTYGTAEGPLPSLGIGYKILTGNAQSVGFVPYVGEGSAVLSVIHINDAINFILKIVDVAVTQEVTGSAESRYYIIYGERVSWKDLATALAKTLHKKGVFSSPEPRSVPLEQAGQGEIPKLLGSNMLVQGDRAEALGFKATAKPMVEHITEDLESYTF
ncbi:NAD(P)-binding protein [Xylona heveae TC161]|uniref:NAD(P)-binding protein n=1 Tax=Xylona heveae (strain CBS 132557 / TC161) TaxID=1328760 RepID=A0A165K2N8_XYLHT|nr:NAD(P)-binding protein [Xylona heveae TC161]KZF26916.1 NAD(P)-binding protein [Xylona heveae TC161]